MDDYLCGLFKRSFRLKTLEHYAVIVDVEAELERLKETGFVIWFLESNDYAVLEVNSRHPDPGTSSL